MTHFVQYFPSYEFFISYSSLQHFKFSDTRKELNTKAASHFMLLQKFGRFGSFQHVGSSTTVPFDASSVQWLP